MLKHPSFPPIDHFGQCKRHGQHFKCNIFTIYTSCYNTNITQQSQIFTQPINFFLFFLVLIISSNVQMLRYFNSMHININTAPKSPIYTCFTTFCSTLTHQIYKNRFPFSQRNKNSQRLQHHSSHHKITYPSLI